MRFREDAWIDDICLSHQYLSLCSIVQQKKTFVANVMLAIPLNIGFKQALSQIIVAFSSKVDGGELT